MAAGAHCAQARVAGRKMKEGDYALLDCLCQRSWRCFYGVRVRGLRERASDPHLGFGRRRRCQPVQPHRAVQDLRRRHLQDRAGGEINCLDPGGFGGVTITKSIIDHLRLVEGGVLVSSTNGIIVNATGRVLLEETDIEGLSGSIQPPGIHGVSIIGASHVTIRNCSIRNFSQNGVNLAAPAGGRVYIINSMIINNNVGVFVQGTVGAGNFGTLVNTIVDLNISAAVKTDGAANKITLVNSSLSGSPTAISALNGATVQAVGPSNFLTGAGAPTSTDTFK